MMHDDCVKISKKRFSIKNGKIFYDNIPLWNTYSKNLKGYEFGYYDPDKTKYPADDPPYYILVCVDNFGDNFHWGRWETKEELDEWLNNPYIYVLYNEKDEIVDIAFNRAESMFKMLIDESNEGKIKYANIKSAKGLNLIYKQEEEL